MSFFVLVSAIWVHLEDTLISNTTRGSTLQHWLVCVCMSQNCFCWKVCSFISFPIILEQTHRPKLKLINPLTWQELLLSHKNPPFSIITPHTHTHTHTHTQTSMHKPANRQKKKISEISDVRNITDKHAIKCFIKCYQVGPMYPFFFLQQQQIGIIVHFLHQ